MFTSDWKLTSVSVFDKRVSWFFTSWTRVKMEVYYMRIKVRDAGLHMFSVTVMYENKLVVT